VEVEEEPLWRTRMRIMLVILEVGELVGRHSFGLGVIEPFFVECSAALALQPP